MYIIILYITFEAFTDIFIRGTKGFVSYDPLLMSMLYELCLLFHQDEEYIDIQYQCTPCADKVNTARFTKH